MNIPLVLLLYQTLHPTTPHISPLNPKPEWWFTTICPIIRPFYPHYIPISLAGLLVPYSMTHSMLVSVNSYCW